MSEEMQEVIDMLHNTCKEQSGAAEGTYKKFKLHWRKFQCTV